MNYDIKEFHLLAEPVVREMSPGVKTHLWGYNGQSPRPMIDVVEGDRVHILVTNKLPEHTSVHWHGQRLPNGMADMAEIEMPLPDNTAPMMTGAGPLGSVEMGGMFSMVKVRKDQKPGDYKDPGGFKHPEGTVAFEWTGEMPTPVRLQSEGGQTMPVMNMPAKEVEVQVRKPMGHSGH